MATHKRLLELALRGLEAERARIDEEMTAIRQQLAGSNSASGGKREKVVTKKASRRKMGASQRKALSESMKKAWVKRRRKK